MANLPQISPLEAKAKASNGGNFVIIDVREDNEVAYSSLAKANIKIPFTHIKMGEIVARINEIPKDKELGILCHSGARSGRVTMYLRQQGYNAVNIQGGIDNWSRTADSSVPRY